MKYVLVYVSAALLLFSCNSEKKSEDKLYGEVMAIHDKLMEQMGDVMRLEKNLNVNIDQLRAEDSTQNQQPRIEYLTTLKNNLQEANQAMMNWMRAFNNEMKGMNHDEKMNYLQEEKQKMQEIKAQINTAIDKAGKAIK